MLTFFQLVKISWVRGRASRPKTKPGQFIGSESFVSTSSTVAPNDLSAFWMPLRQTGNSRKSPRLFVAAKDMHYTTSDGRQVLDGTAGLWCVNAGHARPKIVEAIAKQAAELDYAPAFQMGHPKAFELANRLVDLAPEGWIMCCSPIPVRNRWRPRSRWLWPIIG
jgi:4-aminobutyrate aminotransferase-like enzyme